jgi:acetyl-CoA C-acetyltransferase
MSRAPFVMGKAENAFARNQALFDTTMGWRFINATLSEKYHPYTMGETAENVATQWSISRAAQDAFALNSQEKYQAAHEAQQFADELVPYTVSLGKGKTLHFDKDEHPRLSTLEALGTLKPAFKKEGSVTAGNSSGINDGASALLLVNKEALAQYELKAMAKIKSMAIAGVDPSVMGIGPVPAVRKALQRAGWNAADVDLFELNEAFAAQACAVNKELGIDPAKVNVNGGAIAIGHPIGASGCRILVTLLHEMQRRDAKKGLAALCIGGGMGVSLALER